MSTQKKSHINLSKASNCLIAALIAGSFGGIMKTISPASSFANSSKNTRAIVETKSTGRTIGDLALTLSALFGIVSVLSVAQAIDDIKKEKNLDAAVKKLQAQRARPIKPFTPRPPRGKIL